MQQLWSKTGRGFAISAIALALTACQSMRVPEPIVNPQIESQYTYLPQAGNQPSLAELGYKDFFADARLIKIIDLALANNRDMRVALLNIERTQQQYRITEANELPTIAASGSVTRQKTLSSSTATVYNVGLGATSYELDFWGRVRSLKDAALDNYLATQTSKDATQISLISQIAQAWLNYAFANAHLELAQSTLKSQQESHELNLKRFKAGIDSEVTSRQSQISVETARNDVANYKTQVAQALNALNLLVGQPVPENLLAKNAVRNITKAQTLGTGLSSELLNNRPDLRTYEYQLSAAGANIAAAKASLYPTISLTSTAGLASTELSDLFKSGAFIWSLAPSINLPIFDWGTRKNNIKISETDQKIALANYEKAIQTAFTEVNDALATRAFIVERITAQQRLVEAAEVNYKLSTARFRAGIDSYLTVLDAQRTAYSAQQNLISLQQANLNNQIELYKTLGGGIKEYQTDVVTQQPSSADLHQQKQQEKEESKN